MLCSKFVGASLMVAALAISTGCDSSSTFLPPPPDELRGASTDESSSSVNVPIPRGLESASVGARSIELILDRHEPAELDAYIAAARLQAGVAKFKLRNMSLGKQDPPARQLELVREAAARNPLALILEPANPSDSQLAEIIQKIRENGTPVVLLNRPLEAKGSKAVAPQDAKGAGGTSDASTGAKPLVVIAPPSFTESGRKLVAAVIRNTKNAKLDPRGGAVLLISSIGDSFLPERTAAIKNALKAQGITAVDEITFPRTVEVGAKLLTEKLKANPKLFMVFAVDPQSTAAARQVMAELVPDRVFVQAAYPAEGNLGDMTAVGDFAAVAGFNPTALVRKAISTAVKLSGGQDVPSRVEVPVDVFESPENSTTPQSPAYYKSKDRSKKKGS